LTIDLDRYLSDVRIALGSRGFELSRAEVAGRAVDAGRRSDFRWRWMAVRLSTSVIIASFDAGEARREVLDEFLDACSRWAVQNRRGRRPLGLQSGTAAVAVAVFAGGAGDGLAWASASHGQRFAALAYPVAVDLRAATVAQPRRMIVGRVFTPFLRGIVRDAVETPLATRTSPSSPGGAS
jgi:hypothetical protein